LIWNAPIKLVLKQEVKVGMKGQTSNSKIITTSF
jgi:hypothetical protein